MGAILPKNRFLCGISPPRALGRPGRAGLCAPPTLSIASWRRLRRPGASLRGGPPRRRPADERTTRRRADKTTRSHLHTLRGREARLLVVPSSRLLVVLQIREARPSDASPTYRRENEQEYVPPPALNPVPDSLFPESVSFQVSPPPMWSVTDEPLRVPETERVSPGQARDPDTLPPLSRRDSLLETCPVADRPDHEPESVSDEDGSCGADSFF